MGHFGNHTAERLGFVPTYHPRIHLGSSLCVITMQRDCLKPVTYDLHIRKNISLGNHATWVGVAKNIRFSAL